MLHALKMSKAPSHVEEETKKHTQKGYKVYRGAKMDFPLHKAKEDEETKEGEEHKERFLNAYEVYIELIIIIIL